MGKSPEGDKALIHLVCWTCSAFEGGETGRGRCHLLQNTKNVIFYSQWSTGQSRTELSIPWPLDWLPHRCGACSICLSVSQSCKGRGDKAELLKLPGGISDLRHCMAPWRCGECLWICQILLMIKVGTTHDSGLFGRMFFWGEGWLNFWGKCQVVLELLKAPVRVQLDVQIASSSK